MRRDGWVASPYLASLVGFHSSLTCAVFTSACATWRPRLPMLARDYMLVSVVGCTGCAEKGEYDARVFPLLHRGNRIVRWKRAIARICNPTTIASTSSSSASSSYRLGDALLNVETGGRFPACEAGRKGLRCRCSGISVEGNFNSGLIVAAEKRREGENGWN